MARVYISGGITGVKNYKEHFAKAERFLKGMGHEVVNPVALEDSLPKLTYEEYMRLDMCQLSICNAIKELKVSEVHIKLDKRNRPYLIVNNYIFTFEDFGETVFLTKEEAEAELQRLRGGIDE